MDQDLYDNDFYGWAVRQAEIIRSGHLSHADLTNIAEELETLGRSERNALESAFRLICLHFLKQFAQPERATPSWTHTIVRERLHASRILKSNPGLKPQRGALFFSAYSDGRKEAAAETGKPLALFPIDPPFSFDEMMDETYLVGRSSATPE